jgi:membrane protein
VNTKSIWALLKETYTEWRNDKVPRLAAALSYYMAVAIAPLLVLLVTTVGWFFGNDSAQVQLIGQLQGMVGPQAAEVVEAVVESADEPNVATVAGIVSFLTLLWGASNVFVQLQDSLNTIWGVELKPSAGFMATVKERFLSFGMILVIGFLLLVSLILSAVLTALGGGLRDLLPGMDLIWQMVDFVISFAVTTLLFALIYKVLPDVEIGWRDVLMGATATALLFSIGKWLLGIYLGYSSTSSAYGAAGSLVVLLIWIYYSAQIFFFGAEFTQVYATRYGQGVRPTQDAIARDSTTSTKPAAQAARAGTAQSETQGMQMEAGRTAQTDQPAATALTDQSLGTLVVGLIDDWRRLFRQEMKLARAEMQETLGQVMRNVAAMAGGQLVLYAGVVVLLITLSVLLSTVMPLWFATLLVGLFALIGGWLMVRWALRALKQLKPMPKQTIETLREDVETVKDHLAP